MDPDGFPGRNILTGYSGQVPHDGHAWYYLSSINCLGTTDEQTRCVPDVHTSIEETDFLAGTLIPAAGSRQHGHIRLIAQIQPDEALILFHPPLRHVPALFRNVCLVGISDDETADNIVKWEGCLCKPRQQHSERSANNISSRRRCISPTVTAIGSSDGIWNNSVPPSPPGPDTVRSAPTSCGLPLRNL